MRIDHATSWWMDGRNRLTTTVVLRPEEVDQILERPLSAFVRPVP
jgi:hypothetical protein